MPFFTGAYGVVGIPPETEKNIPISNSPQALLSRYLEAPELLKIVTLKFLQAIYRILY